MPAMTKDEAKQEQARNLRYKRPALALMGWETITSELSEIQSACDDVSYSMSTDSILDAFDGDEERAWEFQMAFADLSAKCEQLSGCLYDHDELSEYFDDCTVALIGNRYESVGYDGYEEDYYHLAYYEQELAQTEAGKRVCRWTKKDMLANIGQCMGVLLAFYDLRQQYDYLKAELDILRGENAAVLQTIKEIEKAYDRQSELKKWQDDPEFEKLLRSLPDRVWIE